MQDLLNQLTAEIQELEEEKRGTWSDFIELMGLSGKFSLESLQPARVDAAGKTKDSRIKIQDMLKKVGF